MMIITPARPVHVEEMLVLAEEMDRFYGAIEIEPYDVRLHQLNEALFTDPPMAHALLAWDEQNLVGMAAYSFAWPRSASQNPSISRSCTWPSQCAIMASESF